MGDLAMKLSEIRRGKIFGMAGRRGIKPASPRDHSREELECPSERRLS
jgi:hypothetical protein